MRKIPLELLKDILSDPYYKTCCRADEGDCDGRITLEHVFIYAGRQINEKWAIIPLCLRHHSIFPYQDNGLLDKRKNELISLNRATDSEMNRYSKIINLKKRRDYLRELYG